MTIAEIIREKRILIPARLALARLKLRNTREARAWLATRVQPEIVAMPKHTQVFRLADVDALKLELDALDRLAKPNA